MLLALVGIGILFALVIAAWKFSGNDSNPIPNLGTTTTPTTGRAHTHAEAHDHPRGAVPVLRGRGRRSCWMDVRNYSSSGRTLFTGTVDPGQSHRFVARRRLWISLGNPGT